MIGGRPFSAWLSRANSRIEELTKDLQDSSSFKEVNNKVAAEIAKNLPRKTALRILKSPKKTNPMRPLSKGMIRLRSLALVRA